jgi:signal recognition particle receptor subunit beta
LKDAPLLLFANKQDLSDAKGPEEIKEYFSSVLDGRKFNVQGISAINGFVWNIIVSNN